MQSFPHTLMALASMRISPMTFFFARILCCANHYGSKGFSGMKNGSESKNIYNSSINLVLFKWQRSNISRLSNRTLNEMKHKHL